MTPWTHTKRESRATIDGAEITVKASATGWHFAVTVGGRTLFGGPFSSRWAAKDAALEVARYELSQRGREGK